MLARDPLLPIDSREPGRRRKTHIFAAAAAARRVSATAWHAINTRSTTGGGYVKKQKKWAYSKGKKANSRRRPRDSAWLGTHARKISERVASSSCRLCAGASASGCSLP